jgi:hypothetical protein
MASYKLRAADLETLRKEASMYAELAPGYRSWFPIETIPRAVTSKWYTLERVQTPAVSMDGADYVGIRTARTEDSAPIFWLRFKFHWDITEVESAQRNGVPLQADDAMVALRTIDNKIQQFIINGMDEPDVINGATEDGTDLGGTLDATMVGTADSFITHASTAYNHLITNGFAPPYNWIVSDTIAQYLGLPLGAGGGKSQGNYINETFGFTTYIERAQTAAAYALADSENTENLFQSMVYTADDGIWVALAANAQNMALQQVGPPSFTINPEINRDTNKYEGFVEWQGTIRFTHTAAACYMEDVDVA